MQKININRNDKEQVRHKLEHRYFVLETKTETHLKEVKNPLYA